jgi:hypothetical protein
MAQVHQDVHREFMAGRPGSQAPASRPFGAPDQPQQGG